MNTREEGCKLWVRNYKMGITVSGIASIVRIAYCHQKLQINIPSNQDLTP